MKWTAVLSVVLLSAVMVPSAWSGFYRWVDKDGREFYTNELSKIPSQYREKAVSVETDTSRVSIGEGAAPQAGQISTSEHKDIKGRGEAYWRARAQKLRRQIAALQDEYEIILKQEREQEEKEKSQIRHRKKSSGKLSRKKLSIEKKLARLKRELEVELPEEARRAGAYPGWIRE